MILSQELRDVTCHMGSNSVTCHPTQANVPRLTPAMQAGTRFTYPGGMEGWVDFVDLIAPRPGVEPATFQSRVRSQTAAPPRHHTYEPDWGGGMSESCTAGPLHCSIIRSCLVISVEFWAKQRNLDIFMEFLCFRGILRNSTLIIIIIIIQHAPCQCVAPLATNSLHSNLSKASSIASSKVRLCRDRSLFKVAIQEV